MLGPRACEQVLTLTLTLTLGPRTCEQVLTLTLTLTLGPRACGQVHRAGCEAMGTRQSGRGLGLCSG